MGPSLLSLFILFCKIVSLISLLVSVYSYHWFEIDNYSVNKHSIQKLCVSYGAFCNSEELMPLPRLIVILPCILSFIGVMLEILNFNLLYSIWQRDRSILNFFLEQINIALTCAMTIHCTWVVIVHIRISMEMDIVHLDWSFYAFTIASILIPIDSICSIIRVMRNCQYEKTSQARNSMQVYTCRNKSIVDSDI